MEVWGEGGGVRAHMQSALTMPLFKFSFHILVRTSSLRTKNSTDGKYSHKMIVTQIRIVSL